MEVFSRPGGFRPGDGRRGALVGGDENGAETHAGEDGVELEPRFFLRHIRPAGFLARGFQRGVHGSPQVASRRGGGEVLDEGEGFVVVGFLSECFAYPGGGVGRSEGGGGEDHAGDGRGG